MNSFTTRIIHILFLSTILCSSCKKDKLHFNKVTVLNSNTTDRLNAITQSNSVIYIAGGNRYSKATIVISRDNGESWQAMDFPQAGKSLYGISANQYGHVYACGIDAVLLWTTDKGYNWNYKLMGNWQPFKDLSFSNNTAVGIMGVSYNSGGIAIIDSAGSILKYDSVGIEYNDIEMVNAQTGYISGYGVMLKTTDGGKTWGYQNVKNDNFTAISAINENNLWICGINGSIYHTVNGGNDWERKRNGNDLTKPKYHLHDLLFIDDSNGWAVGEDGLVVQTSDGGSHWTEYEKFTTNALHSIVMLPDGNLLVCGDNGGIYKLMR